MNLPKVMFGQGFITERVLSNKARKDIPKSKEAVPAKHGKSGAYPMPDAAHRRSAIGFAVMHHGKDSAIYRKVKAKADSLAKSDKPGK